MSNTLFEKWQIEQDIQDRYPTDILQYIVAPVVTSTSKVCKVCRELQPTSHFRGKLKGESGVCLECLPRKIEPREGKLSYNDRYYIRYWLKQGFSKAKIAKAFNTTVFIINKVKRGE